MSIPHWSSHCAAIARKHGSWAQGIEARVMAEAIATEIEAGPPPGLSAGRGGGGDVGPHHPAGSSLPTFQPEGEDNEPTT
jgi:hypothetical protein